MKLRSQELFAKIKLVGRIPPAKNWMLLAGDLILIVVSAMGSFALRLDIGPLFVWYLPQAYWFIGVALVIKPVVYYVFGLYRRLWAYASTQELKLIIASVTSASVGVSIVILILRVMQVLPYFPRGVLPIDWLLSLLLVGDSVSRCACWQTPGLCQWI
jgi:FlaA1/EpsC-like NDP-sugar epimerase